MYNPNGEFLGSYNKNKNKTFDAYGHFMWDGQEMRDLLYLPRPVHFPLKSLNDSSFTTARIKREKVPNERNVPSWLSPYWDGYCRICKREKPTVVGLGLPSMCKPCYRILLLYSKSDKQGLEAYSKRNALKVEQIKNV